MQDRILLATPSAFPRIAAHSTVIPFDPEHPGGGPMLLTDKVCIITGAASQRGIGRATARLFSQHGGRVVIVDLDEAQAKGGCRRSRRGTSRLRLQRHRQAVVPGRRGARDRRVWPGRRAGQQCRHHAAAQDHGHPGRELRCRPGRQPARHALHEPGRHSADARAALRLHRVHVLGVGAARRRHLRRSPLQRRKGRRAWPGQGHGAGTRSGYVSG